MIEQASGVIGLAVSSYVDVPRALSCNYNQPRTEVVAAVEGTLEVGGLDPVGLECSQ